MYDKKHLTKGFSIIEALIALLLFSIASAVVVSTMVNSLTHLGHENRLSVLEGEKRFAAHALMLDLQAAKVISPYLAGDNPASILCASQLVILNDSNNPDLKGIRLELLKVESSSTNTANGFDIVKVVWFYDSSSKTLKRGSVPLNGFSCTASPLGDPYSAGNSFTVLEGVSPLPGNGPDLFFRTDDLIKIAFSNKLLVLNKTEKEIPFNLEVKVRS
jgi:hypothetical protein